MAEGQEGWFGFEIVTFLLRGMACLEKVLTCPEEVFPGGQGGGGWASLYTAHSPGPIASLGGQPSLRDFRKKLGIGNSHSAPQEPRWPTKESANLQRPNQLHTQHNCG